jgi:hypothetical protein
MVLEGETNDSSDDALDSASPTLKLKMSTGYWSNSECAFIAISDP